MQKGVVTEGGCVLKRIWAGNDREGTLKSSTKRIKYEYDSVIVESCNHN